MIGLSEPITVTVSHKLGRDEAKRRIERGLGSIRQEVSQYVSSTDYRWDDYCLNFRVVVLRQSISGRIDVYDDRVRIEFTLPRLLHLVAKTVAGRIERRGTALLEGPKDR